MRFAAAALGSVLLVACTRPATQQDCELIVDRNVEVQMKAMNFKDPDQIAKRQAEMRAQLGDELKACVGRRITDGTIECVKKATTGDELDACLR
jgi:hypothetical protein